MPPTFDSIVGIEKALSPFLKKVCDITQTCDPSIALWGDEGDRFIVLDSKQFENKVLSLFFRGNLKTFIRQLHFYGFKKTESITKKNGDKKTVEWSFSHPCFLRDTPEEILNVKRKTNRSISNANGVRFEEWDSLQKELVHVTEKTEELQTQLASEMLSVRKDIEFLKKGITLLDGFNRNSINLWRSGFNSDTSDSSNKSCDGDTLPKKKRQKQM